MKKYIILKRIGQVLTGLGLVLGILMSGWQDYQVEMELTDPMPKVYYLTWVFISIGSLCWLISVKILKGRFGYGSEE